VKSRCTYFAPKGKDLKKRETLAGIQTTGFDLFIVLRKDGISASKVVKHRKRAIKSNCLFTYMLYECDVLLTVLFIIVSSRLGILSLGKYSILIKRRCGKGRKLINIRK
jgi:hypothetical protein